MIYAMSGTISAVCGLGSRHQCRFTKVAIWTLGPTRPIHLATPLQGLSPLRLPAEQLCRIRCGEPGH